MESIDSRDIGALDRVLADLLEELPQARRELHQDLAALMKEEVDDAIPGSGVTDGQGRVRGWQREHVGTGGGYAAVRPVGSKEGAATGPNSPGAITNYLEEGHKIPSPRGGKNYRPKIKKPYVDGRHFYRAARGSLEPKAIGLAEEFAGRLADRLEGGER